VIAAANIRPEATTTTVVALVDPEVAELQRRVALLASFYERKVLPTLIGTASILGAVVIVAQLAKWIAR
jgi:hypothetical protein